MAGWAAAASSSRYRSYWLVCRWPSVSSLEPLCSCYTQRQVSNNAHSAQVKAHSSHSTCYEYTNGHCRRSTGGLHSDTWRAGVVPPVRSGYCRLCSSAEYVEYNIQQHRARFVVDGSCNAVSLNTTPPYITSNQYVLVFHGYRALVLVHGTGIIHTDEQETGILAHVRIMRHISIIRADFLIFRKGTLYTNFGIS